MHMFTCYDLLAHLHVTTTCMCACYELLAHLHVTTTLHVCLLWIVTLFTHHGHCTSAHVMTSCPFYTIQSVRICTHTDFLAHLHIKATVHVNTSKFLSIYIYKSKPHRACALVYDPQARANVTVTAHVHKATSAYVVTCCGCWVVQMCTSKLGNNSLCRSDSLKICFPLNLLMCNGVRNVHTWPNCHLYVGRVTRLLNPDDHIVKGCTWIPHPNKAKM